MIDFLKEARGMQEELIYWRRDFHRFPELRFEERRTAAAVSNHLQKLGYDVTTGIGKTGVVGVMRFGKPGRVGLLRFDMDALPIQEENEVDYKSQVDGVMHACGHDSHTAMGMGVASLLARHRDELAGTVKLVYQPAEEGAGGARAMIRDGVLENPRPDISFGIHIHSQSPPGQIQIGDGPILAAADRFDCTITGKGGHGAEPHKAADALVAACQIVNLLQTILSRNVDQLKTAILSVCSIHAGSAFNIIPERAELSGTIRTYEEEIRELVHRRMHEIVESTARALGVSAKLIIEDIVPAAVNDPEICAASRRLAARLVGPENVSTQERATPSDDIAEFLQAAPGCHMVLGASLGANETPHHNPRFNIDESVMPIGVAMLCEEVAYFLGKAASTKDA